MGFLLSPTNLKQSLSGMFELTANHNGCILGKAGKENGRLTWMGRVLSADFCSVYYAHAVVRTGVRFVFMTQGQE